jgi:hypothetical protein
LDKLPTPSPDRYQVAYLLGRLLTEQVLSGSDIQPENARSLLREAIDGRIELRLAALSSLLLLELQLDDRSPAVTALRDQLAHQVLQKPGTRVHHYEAWQTLGLAFAAADDLAGLERASAEVYALSPGDDAPRLAQFELSVAGFPVNPETRRRYASLARSRLESMPPSADRELMLQHADELLRDAP